MIGLIVARSKNNVIGKNGKYFLQAIIKSVSIHLSLQQEMNS